MKCNGKVENSGEIKRQKGRGKVEESVTINAMFQLLDIVSVWITFCIHVLRTWLKITWVPCYYSRTPQKDGKHK